MSCVFDYMSVHVAIPRSGHSSDTPTASINKAHRNKVGMYYVSSNKHKYSSTCTKIEENRCEIKAPT